MEKKTIIKSNHKYNLINPYNGGAQALYYDQTQLQLLINKNNLLRTQTDFLQLLLQNPARPN